MCRVITADDIGKRVENAAGEDVGVITTIDDDGAHVRPAADAIKSINSSIGWDDVGDVTYPLDPDAVCEITDEVVRLEGGLPANDFATDTEAEPGARDATDTQHGATRTGADEETMDRGLEVDPTKLAGANQTVGTQTDAAVDPDAVRDADRGSKTDPEADNRDETE
ncbi:hypothetical protein [Natronorubrum sp. A-ect3]|uniref:hypothetical protein n=1 Tax=Natronorubrum sp. A-ect3 TaxID=3242698 RepID=UPI00359DBC70